MKLPAVVFSIFLGCACAALLTGCLPSAQDRGDEEKEPHFITGKNSSATMDYEGAVEAFQKALEVNPRSAAAHFELACLFDQKEADPAAAIYHYQSYVKLRPESGNTGLVKERIMTCKQELARNVSLGPLTERQQRELEQLAEENKKLNEQVKVLNDEVEKWRAYAARMQLTTNAPATSSAIVPRTAGSSNASTVRGASSPPLELASSVSSRTNSTSAANTSSPRTHTIKAGETASLIARKYGVKVDALLLANPRVDPYRLKVGQTLVIPGQ